MPSESYSRLTGSDAKTFVTPPYAFHHTDINWQAYTLQNGDTLKLALTARNIFLHILLVYFSKIGLYISYIFLHTAEGKTQQDHHNRCKPNNCQLEQCHTYTRFYLNLVYFT